MRWLNQLSDTLIDKVWYGDHPLQKWLYPFSWCYRAIAKAHQFYWLSRRKCFDETLIIVVGNLTVGGVGKTPLVVELVHFFQNLNLRVGIVSRGYGAKTTHFPHWVTTIDTADTVGDEPLLLAQKTSAPVVIAPRRVHAVRDLLKRYPCDIVISDDGLQHGEMARNIEIVVIDGERGLGNQQCLPSGPLREPVSRLKSVDFIVANSGHWPGAYRMDFVPQEPISIKTGKTLRFQDFMPPVAAVAAIGHPQRFFNTLAALNIPYQPYPFPDHYQFNPHDLILKEKVVVMTEKDAVKCRAFATTNMYYLPIQAKLENRFWTALSNHPQLKKVLLK